jgi:glycerol-3-phosphate acyltransferase PlsY
MVIAIPFILWFFYGAEPYVIGLGVLYAALALWRHRANIGRLIHGTESKIGEKVQR